VETFLITLSILRRQGFECCGSLLNEREKFAGSSQEVDFRGPRLPFSLREIVMGPFE